MGEYFVLDAAGRISNSKHGEPESFANLTGATKRARTLARWSDPGQTVVIAQAIAYVTSEVSPPTVTMRKLRGRR